MTDPLEEYENEFKSWGPPTENETLRQSTFKDVLMRIENKPIMNVCPDCPSESRMVRRGGDWDLRTEHHVDCPKLRPRKPT